MNLNETTGPEGEELGGKWVGARDEASRALGTFFLFLFLYANNAYLG